MVTRWVLFYCEHPNMRCVVLCWVFCEIWFGSPAAESVVGVSSLDFLLPFYILSRLVKRAARVWCGRSLQIVRPDAPPSLSFWCS